VSNKPQIHPIRAWTHQGLTRTWTRVAALDGMWAKSKVLQHRHRLHVLLMNFPERPCNLTPPTGKVSNKPQTHPIRAWTHQGLTRTWMDSCCTLIYGMGQTQGALSATCTTLYELSKTPMHSNTPHREGVQQTAKSKLRLINGGLRTFC
jgi:hypothetical protein